MIGFVSVHGACEQTQTSSVQEKTRKGRASAPPFRLPAAPRHLSSPLLSALHPGLASHALGCTDDLLRAARNGPWSARYPRRPRSPCRSAASRCPCRSSAARRPTTKSARSADAEIADRAPARHADVIDTLPRKTCTFFGSSVVTPSGSSLPALNGTRPCRRAGAAGRSA